METIRRILAAPVFEDQEKTRSAALLNTILYGMLSVISLTIIGAILGQEQLQIIIAVLVFALLLLGLIVLLRKGFVKLVSIALVVSFLLVLTFVNYLSGTARLPVVSGYLLVTMIAGLTISRRAALWSTGASILAFIGLVLAELGEILPPADFAISPSVGFQQVMVFSAMIVMSTILLNQAVNRIRTSLELAEENQEELAMLNEELGRRVAVATRGLEERSAYLEGAAEISRAAASILDTDDLVRQVVTRIQVQFDLYYVGLFLVDERNEWAVLQAGTGEAGRKMLAQGHRIEIGEGMIGWSIANAKARIALDVGEDAVRFDNPDLPETRSEVAVPLRSRGRVLGALTIQSVEKEAFGQDIITVFQTMADQLAVALDNAELFAKSEAALEAERRAYAELSQDAWKELTRSKAIVSHYIADTSGAARPLQVQRSTRPLRVTDETIQDDGLTAVIPIKSRGNVLGGIKLSRSEDSGEWTQDQLALAETLSEQISTALESARLYQDTQRRAAREQLIGEVTSQMRETLEMKAVLNTAAREISEALGLAALDVRLDVREQ